MVAQVACIHAQGFGINFVPLHHIVAKAPCIARGTMLKPGDEPGFFSFGCTWIFLFLDIKKRPKLLKFGRFVYIFVYVLRKTLIFKVYCGERGIRTPGTSQYAGFQDRCIRPLCHLSMGCEISGCVNEKTLASVSIRKRRERDSNPRYLSVRRFSRPVHSTTLPSLQ